MQTLYEEVSQALEDAHAGKLDQTGVIAVLRRVQEHLATATDAEVQRPLQTLKAVLSRLTYSEELALTAVMKALPDPTGGLVVAARVADNAGLSRSVIVNILRKLEGAGVIECWSLGMKGTRIKILFPGLREHLLSVA